MEVVDDYLLPIIDVMRTGCLQIERCDGKEGGAAHAFSSVLYNILSLLLLLSTVCLSRTFADFVACGAAAGIASAFGAPIGGVLLSLEEGASYWSTNLTWRAFFCAMITLGTLFVVRNQDSKWGQANVEKLFSLGEFTSIGGGSSNFSVWELLLFILIGCLGGLIGACFNAGSEHLTIWRMKHINHSKKRRVLEVLAISMLVTTVSFVMPLLWGRCTELPTDMQDWTNQEKELVANLVPFNCVPGKEYNEGSFIDFVVWRFIVHLNRIVS